MDGTTHVASTSEEESGSLAGATVLGNESNAVGVQVVQTSMRIRITVTSIPLAGGGWAAEDQTRDAVSEAIP